MGQGPQQQGQMMGAMGQGPQQQGLRPAWGPPPSPPCSPPGELRVLLPLERGLAKGRSDCVNGDGASSSGTPPPSAVLPGEGETFDSKPPSPQSPSYSPETSDDETSLSVHERALHLTRTAYPYLQEILSSTVPSFGTIFNWTEWFLLGDYAYKGVDVHAVERIVEHFVLHATDELGQRSAWGPPPSPPCSPPGDDEAEEAGAAEAAPTFPVARGATRGGPHHFAARLLDPDRPDPAWGAPWAGPMGPPPPPPPAPPGGDEAEGAEDAEAAPTFPHYVEMLNKGVVILQHVSDPRFRRTYAQLLDGRVTPGGRVSPEAPDGRVSVRVLPIEIRRAPPPVLPRAPIRVRADAIRAVGRMRYYTAAHPDVAAQMATPERLAAQSVPREFADSQAVVTVGVPSGTMAARLYVDCRPPDETPGLLQLLEVNARDYDRGAQTGATAKLFEDRICKGALPPPELYIYHLPY